MAISVAFLVFSLNLGNLKVSLNAVRLFFFFVENGAFLTEQLDEQQKEQGENIGVSAIPFSLARFLIAITRLPSGLGNIKSF